MKLIAFIPLFILFSNSIEKTAVTDTAVCISAEEKKLYDLIAN